MKKEEVLEHFKENCVNKKSVEKMLALEEYYQQHKDALGRRIYKVFKRNMFKNKRNAAKK